MATGDRTGPSVCLEADQVVFLYSKFTTKQYTTLGEECENVCEFLCVCVCVCTHVELLETTYTTTITS